MAFGKPSSEMIHSGSHRAGFLVSILNDFSFLNQASSSILERSVINPAPDVSDYSSSGEDERTAPSPGGLDDVEGSFRSFVKVCICYYGRL